MYLQDIATEQFILIQADWSVGRALRTTQRLSVTHVVVHRICPPEDYHYLYRVDEFTEMLRSADPAAVLEDALHLHEGDASATADALAHEEDAPHERIVVLDEGRMVGIVDRTSAAGLPYLSPWDGFQTEPELGAVDAMMDEEGMVEDAGPCTEGVRRRAPVRRMTRRRPRTAPPAVPVGPEEAEAGGGAAEEALAERDETETAVTANVRRFIVANFPEQVELGDLPPVLVPLLEVGCRS